MSFRACVLLCGFLTACASPPPIDQPPPFLFRDESFAAPPERFGADDLFVLTDSMRRFLRQELARQLRSDGPVNGLIEALSRSDQLKLRYDPAVTRNASEAFAARAGNCLSLVIMTAAFAKELGLYVQYNAANAEQVWSRSGGLLVGSGHINVALGVRQFAPGSRVYQLPTTVDFLPADEISALPIREVPERTVISMYMNNRAAEDLMRGELDDAYGWARAAIRFSPEFEKSYNTLGLVYLHHGDLVQAARVFGYQLQRDPNDRTVMSNLADTLSRMGREAEAAVLRSRLAQIDPDPPYHFFDLGQEAMQRGDFMSAKSLFAREVGRADYNDEFHYWLGLAYFKLGEIEKAQKQLMLALQTARSRSEHDRYAGKLAWLQTAGRARPDTRAPDALQ